MVTDDPGTPGNGHWEINVAWTDQEQPGVRTIGLPLLDANYGVGDRLQLNYQASWNVIDAGSAAADSGMSDSQLACKWRFYDAGETGLQVSTYPRYTFVNPSSRSDRRGTADPNATFLLPAEVRHAFGRWSVNADFGRTFSGSASERGWMGGVCVGAEILKGWEIDAEAHATTLDRLGSSEVILNAGVRHDFSEHLTLLLAVGADARNTIAPRSRLLTYAGLQLRL
jgi:hypothetical protein